jgi:methylated-DNA-[protein]-cysteine S-methyltransferase
MKTQFRMESAIGPLYLVASEKLLHGLHWKRQSVAMGTNRLLKRAVRQVEEYLAGKRREFDLPVEAEGTEFQKRVWAALAKIPYGETSSYREIAKRIGKPKAFRAVGTANGRNPVSLIIPCHRVIATDGTLGGYAGGLPLKTRLLQIEARKR